MAYFVTLGKKGAALYAAMASALVVFSAPAHAQFSGSYVNTTDGALNNSAASCSAALIRTINVPDDVIISDVDLGYVIDHNNRSDTAMALRHPDGTQITIHFGTGGTLNDYNVRFDQDAAIEVDQGAHAVNNNSTAPRYEFTVRPRAAVSLDTFNGKSSAGNWTLLACDNSNNGGSDIGGQFRHAEIFITGISDTSDLNLSMTASNNSPSYGSNVTMTLSLAHEGGTVDTSGVTVEYQLPSGLNFQSASGDGSYNNATGVWTVGNMPLGSTATLNVTAEVLSSGTYNNVAEVSASNNFDPDSTPGNANANPSEDDTASVTLTPGSSGGTGPSGEPSLSCPSPAVFDWDSNPWAYNASVLSRSYPAGGSDGTSFTISYSGDTNFRDSNSPATNNDMEGGLSPVEQSLYYFQNINTPGASVDIDIDIGAPGVGVQDFQMTVFDIDFASGQFRDRLVVSGFMNGAAVTPVLTAGSANSAAGSTVVGTQSSDNASAAANVIVTFLSPVDRIRVNYSNPEASSGTSNQAMAIHDFNYCARQRDFGDIATSYGTPDHLIGGGVFIGSTFPDGEASTQVSANADGDDIAGSDDEDTLDFSGLTVGVAGDVDVDLTGSGGFLQMWIDWNGDGDFADMVDGVSEQVASDVQIVGTTGTANVSFTVPASATLSQTYARLRWSSQSGLGPTGTASDGEVEDHVLTIGGAAALSGAKTTNIFDPLGEGLYALPGNDVIYTITVTNTGAGPTDNDSVFLVDRIPAEIEFWNGDIDQSSDLTVTGEPDTFAGTNPVGFTQSNGAALTFNYGNDVAFATGATAPATFADCTSAAPDNTYRTDLTFICFNPKGALASGDPDPEFSVSFRGRIK